MPTLKGEKVWRTACCEAAIIALCGEGSQGVVASRQDGGPSRSSPKVVA